MHPSHTATPARAHGAHGWEEARASILGEESMDTAFPQQESPPAPSQGQGALAKGRPDLHHTLPAQPSIWGTSPSWLRGTFDHTQLSLWVTETGHGDATRAGRR